MRKVWRRQKTNWKTVVIRQVFNRFFDQMTMQYSNIYIRELGASPIELGEVNSASGITSALISLPLGILQDRYSVRKIFLFGIALLTLVPLIYALSNSWEFTALAILLTGLGNRLGSCVVICDLSLPNEDRATGKALCEGLGAIPSLIAPTVAAFIITWIGGINVRSIRLLFWMQLVARIVLFLYVVVRLTEIDRPPRKESGLNFMEEMRDLLSRGVAVRRWLLYISISMFTGTMMMTFLYPYVYEVKGANQFIIGGVATLITLSEALFSIPLGRTADKVGRKKVLYILIPLFSLANFLLILIPTPIYLLPIAVLLGFRMIAGYIAGSMTPELVPKDCIGRWRGIIGLSTGLITIPAPIIGGILWERLGPGYILMTIAIIDLLLRMILLKSMPETLHLKHS